MTGIFEIMASSPTHWQQDIASNLQIRRIYKLWGYFKYGLCQNLSYIASWRLAEINLGVAPW
jgi:hypothetical protein